VSGIFEWPDDGRRPGLGYAALIPEPPIQPFDECWAEAWPENGALQGLLPTALVPAHADRSTPAEFASVNATLGASFPGTRRFEGRMTRFAPPVAALAALVVAIVAVRLRRLELAAAHHFGARRSDLTAITLTETAIVLIVPVIVGLAVVLAVSTTGIGEGDSQGLVAAGCRVIATAVGSMLLGACVAALSIRPRTFLRYMQERS
jgi:hypothetical protein